MPTTVKLGRVSYTFDIKSKFTVIRGDSGIGKTTLFSMLDRVGKKGAVLESAYIFLRLTRLSPNMSWDKFFKSAEDDRVVFYADEDFEELYSAEFQKAMNQSELRFLIVVRDLLAHVPYGVRDVYTVQREGVVHKLVPLYAEQALEDVKGLEVLVTEDSKSGYFFFKSFLKSVDSARGKSNIFKEWEARNNTLFVVDGVGFGSEIGKIAEASKRKGTNALWIIDSFEALVLQSDFVLDGQEPNIFEGNKEQFYENRLKEVMSLEGQIYSKSSPCGCLLLDCCYKLRCGFYCKGLKPQLILGEVFEKLAVFGLKSKAERIQTIEQLQAQQSVLQDTNCGWD